MRPLKTTLLCATMFLLASAAWAQQQPPEPVAVPAPGQSIPPAPVLSEAAASELTAAALGGTPPGQFPQRKDSSNNTVIQPGCASDVSAFEVHLDAMFLTLNPASSQTYIVDQPTQWPLADIKDLTFDPELGPRITLDYQTSDGPIFELCYFGIYNWSSEADFRGNGTLTLPYHFQQGTVDFNDADRMHVNYQSRINNLEANLIYSSESNRNLGFLVGLRFMKLDEEFYLRSFDQVDPVAPISGSSYYDIHTKNDLYGAQMGSSWRACFRRFDMRLVTKVGVFDDEAKQSQVITDRNSTVVMRDTAFRRGRGVLMTEANLSLIYCLRNKTYLQFGYDVLWIDRVARAPDQLDFTLSEISGTNLNFGAGALMHGPHFGLESRW